MNKKRILVLAPHTDDGEFGCGASIARFIAEGADVYYAAFSLAEESVPPPFPKNILETEVWAFTRKRDVLDERFLKSLHKRMFGRVWRWAGKFRQSERNIGVKFYRIPVDLRQLLDDCHYWIENETYPTDEIAARFHHRLVLIHPFPNGNGRHARLATDLLLVKLGRPRFSWGSVNLVDPGETRQKYVAALRAADNHDIGPLFEFVRS